MRIKLIEKSIAAINVPAGRAQLVVWDTDVTGFGLVIGKATRTFIAEARVDGAKRRTKIGLAGHVRPDGQRWTVQLAKQRAKEILGVMAAGVDPNATKRACSGPTLRDGMEAHLVRMTKKNRAERSIETFRYEMTKHLADWLDRPIAELDGQALEAIIDGVKARTPKRIGTNPKMVKGAYLANRIIAHVSAAWRSLNRKLQGKLGNWNPANAVDKDHYEPKRERIENLPDWSARVATMRSPIRRDGLTFALYTALRHEDVRSIRFEHVDFAAGTLRLPDPKGGAAAAFTIPLCPTALDIVKRRQADNTRDTGKPDGGWAFPGTDNEGNVCAIFDLRMRIRKTNTRFPIEDVHSLRREWESIAQEEGISEIDQHVLTNHSFANHNVNASYINQHIDHLAACALRMDAAITRRIKGEALARAQTLRAA